VPFAYFAVAVRVITPPAGIVVLLAVRVNSEGNTVTVLVVVVLGAEATTFTGEDTTEGAEAKDAFMELAPAEAGVYVKVAFPLVLVGVVPGREGPK